MSNEIDVKKFGDLEENVIQKHHSNFRYLTPSNLFHAKKTSAHALTTRKKKLKQQLPQHMS